MTAIKAGDTVEYIGHTSAKLSIGDIREVREVDCGYVFLKGQYRDGSTPHFGMKAWRFRVVPDQGKARNTDPDTSKTAAKIKRTPLRERLYSLIESKPTGVVGTGAADLLESPLNSVTPRFAELRKAGRIKDSGVRLNGQIVWVLA